MPKDITLLEEISDQELGQVNGGGSHGGGYYSSVGAATVNLTEFLIGDLFQKRDILGHGYPPYVFLNQFQE